MAEIEKSGLPGAPADGRSPCPRRIGVAVRGVRDGAVRVKVRAMSLKSDGMRIGGVHDQSHYVG